MHLLPCFLAARPVSSVLRAVAIGCPSGSRAARGHGVAAAGLAVMVIAAGPLATSARVDGPESNPCPATSPPCRDDSGPPDVAGQAGELGRDIASDALREARRRVRQEARREWRRALDRLFGRRGRDEPAREAGPPAGPAQVAFAPDSPAARIPRLPRCGGGRQAGGGQPAYGRRCGYVDIMATVAFKRRTVRTGRRQLPARTAVIDHRDPAHVHHRLRVRSPVCPTGPGPARSPVLARRAPRDRARSPGDPPHRGAGSPLPGPAP